MATTLETIDINELSLARLGYITGVSLTDWSVTTVSQYAAGSRFEDDGSLYSITADEDMGTVGEWGAIGVSTLVYSYHNPATLTFYYSSTAPAWDDAKQGHYHTVSTTHRCLASIYKDALGAYTQKTILSHRDYGLMYTGINTGGQAANADHIIRLATDASILWDESGDQFTFDKAIESSGSIKSLGNIRTTSQKINADSVTSNTMFDTVSPSVPTTGDYILITGCCTYRDAGLDYHLLTPAFAIRTNATTITFYMLDYNITDGSFGRNSYTGVDGTADLFLLAAATNQKILIAW